MLVCIALKGRLATKGTLDKGVELGSRVWGELGLGKEGSGL